MRASITLEGDIELRNAMVRAQKGWRGSRRPVLERIANRLKDSIQARLRAGNFTPLSLVTLKMRKGGGSAPLIDSGEMLDSIETSVTDRVAAAGSSKGRAGWNQFGITTSEDSAIPGKVVPARPFILFSEEDATWALDLLADDMLREFDAAA